MKQREYTITAGSYDDYRIVGRVAGPERPALSTLWKQFAEQFGVFAQPEPHWNDPAWHMWLTARIKTNTAAEEVMRKAGYGGDMAEAFVAWLVARHGFETLKSDTFHVSR